MGAVAGAIVPGPVAAIVPNLVHPAPEVQVDRAGVARIQGRIGHGDDLAGPPQPDVPDRLDVHHPAGGVVKESGLVKEADPGHLGPAGEFLEMGQVHLGVGEAGEEGIGVALDGGPEAGQGFQESLDVGIGEGLDGQNLPPREAVQFGGDTPLREEGAHPAHLGPAGYRLPNPGLQPGQEGKVGDVAVEAGSQLLHRLFPLGPDGAAELDDIEAGSRFLEVQAGRRRKRVKGEAFQANEGGRRLLRRCGQKPSGHPHEEHYRCQQAEPPSLGHIFAPPRNSSRNIRCCPDNRAGRYQSTRMLDATSFRP